MRTETAVQTPVEESFASLERGRQEADARSKQKENIAAVAVDNEIRTSPISMRA
jgi:hypothetical protein